MITWLSKLISDVESLVTAGIAAAAALYVAAIWWRTKALVPTLTAILVAGVVVWAASNVDFLEQRVADDAMELYGEVRP